MNRFPFRPGRGHFPSVRGAHMEPGGFGQRGQFSHWNAPAGQMRPFYSPRPDIFLSQGFSDRGGEFWRGGSRGRANSRGFRGRRGAQDQAQESIENYYLPSMMQDPWKELEEEYWKKHPKSPPLGEAPT